ncbi:unnamed protein product [Meganyctiphanes norvegica]|uniref:Uncharacterized protein n=1 Tax=Meganyctiphanes norvegica TaxID=48144 RepID=A0AAV2PQV2_MEGNR
MSRNELYYDKENGEELQEKVFTIRRSPNRRNYSFHKRRNSFFPLSCDDIVFSGFKINSKQIFYNGLYSNYFSESKNPKTNNKPICNEQKSHSYFKITEDIFIQSNSDEQKDFTSVYITPWEEFLYGGECIDNEIDYFAKAGMTLIERCLRKCFSTCFVESYIIIIYFLAIIVPIIIYDDFTELLGVIMFLSHLEIHIRAMKYNTNVQFSDATYSSPTMQYMREFGWCHHCEHKRLQKIMFRQIVSYRNECKTSKNFF